jgi:hypothetical protein
LRRYKKISRKPNVSGAIFGVKQKKMNRDGGRRRSGTEKVAKRILTRVKMPLFKNVKTEKNPTR